MKPVFTDCGHHIRGNVKSIKSVIKCRICESEKPIIITRERVKVPRPIIDIETTNPEIIGSRNLLKAMLKTGQHWLTPIQVKNTIDRMDWLSVVSRKRLYSKACQAMIRNAQC